jgi:hypothetical protein
MPTKKRHQKAERYIDILKISERYLVLLGASSWKMAVQKQQTRMTGKYTMKHSKRAIGDSILQSKCLLLIAVENAKDFFKLLLQGNNWH